MLINVLYTKIYSAHRFHFLITSCGQRQKEHITFFGKIAHVFLQEKVHVPKQQGHLLCSQFGPEAKDSPHPKCLGREVVAPSERVQITWVFFLSTTEGKIERKIGRLLCGASAVMQAC